jgi:hypothetical protein
VTPVTRARTRRKEVDSVVVRHFHWDVEYDAEGYIQLLNTFSGHIAMKPWQRDRVYSEIRTRLDRRTHAFVVAGARSCRSPGAETSRPSRRAVASCGTTALGCPAYEFRHLLPWRGADA